MKSTTLLSSLLLLHSASQLAAQSWAETGDAGPLPGTAQAPVGNGALTTISGTLGADADVYLIQIDSPAAFAASTVGGASFDTQLFLFDERGRGITGRDDNGGGVLQTTLTGQFVPVAGRYYLAISPWDRDPIAAGGEIWADAADERRPDGPRAKELLSGWNGTGSGSLYTITLAGVSFPGQQLVLPDNHHLSESASFAGAGSASWFRAGGGRFQLLYEASHFVNAGVTGPIALKKLLFRGEDGEPNMGGALWNGVMVQVGATSLTSATMTTTFATNRGVGTTTLGPAGLTDITLLPSIGSTPNNYNLVIDLTAISAGFPFDPTSSRPNLLVDIIMPAAASLPIGQTAVMQMQDTNGSPAVVRGRGVTTGTSSGTTGTDSASPLLMGIEFVGVGGQQLVVSARNELYGAACGGAPSAFYQSFLEGQGFDLRGLRLQVNDVATPTFYTVDGGAGAFDASMVNAAPHETGDDEIVAHGMPFTFRFPGGATNVVRICTNGFIWLDALTTDTDTQPAVGRLLGNTTNLPARLVPCWYDFHCGRNAVTHPNAGLHVRNDLSGGPGNGKVWITWLDVGVYDSVAVGGTAVHRMQCVLHENGTVEYRYGTMPVWLSSSGSSAALVGWSRGRIGAVASVDPQSRDLSLELPFTTSVEGSTGHIGQTVVATPVAAATYGGRAFAGQTLTWSVNNIPAGTLVGVQLLDLAPSRPGFQLPTITAPGCMLSTTPNAVLWDVHVLPSATVNGAVPLVIPAGLDGAELYSQYVVLGGLFGAPDLITGASNAVKQIVGRQ